LAAGPGAVESWGWGVYILPYLEEQAVYDQLRPADTFLQPLDGTRKGKRNLADVFIASAANAIELVPLQTTISVFRCPSDPTPELVPCDQGGGKCAISGGAAKSTDDDLWWRSFRDGAGQKQSPNAANFLPPAANYVGNKGMIDNSCPQAAGSATWQPNDLICGNNGIFFANSHVSLKEITDGTGKTFMIGERDRFCNAGTWIGARNPEGGDQMHSSLWVVAHTAFQLNFPLTQAYETCNESFSSPHKGGGYFAFCDGSVRFITDDISSSLGPNGTNKSCLASKTDPLRCRSSAGTSIIGIYQRLSWRDDGELIDSTDY
jgi:prepilin-type processing-associated H-X9-DG protein